MVPLQTTRPSPWPHRLAVALALATFPLIWVGGLVTTYDAGMAVPDWPSTYGYNLFLYPWQTWIAGPWDLFIEHGHRLLGAAAGLLAIALVAVVLLADRRRWLVWAALGALLLVIFQGLLGGARVLFDARLIAMIHGCVGPLFFAYLAALIVATRRRSEAGPLGAASETAANRLARNAWILAALAYIQLVLGAIVRHVPLSASPQVFRAALLLHLVAAGLLTIQVTVALWQTWRQPFATDGLPMTTHHSRIIARLPALLVALLLAIQLGLGAATYVAKYSWPGWLANYPFAASYVVQEKSLPQSLITTAHVANGSLILFLTVLLAARTWRLRARAAEPLLRADYCVLSADKAAA